MLSYETSTIDTIWMGKGLFEHPTFSMTMVCTKFYTLSLRERGLY